MADLDLAIVRDPQALIAEVERLREANARLSANHTALADRLARLLRERSEARRAADAAAKRAAWDEVEHALGGTYLEHVLDLADEPLRVLAAQVHKLPDRPKAVADVRRRAEEAVVHLELARRQARTTEPVTAVQTLLDRVRQLRRRLREAGWLLHQRSGQDAQGCRCDGCQLIREMDVDNESVRLPGDVLPNLRERPHAGQPALPAADTYAIWRCDKCGDHSECQPGETCEVCCEGTVQVVECVPVAEVERLRVFAAAVREARDAHLPSNAPRFRLLVLTALNELEAADG